VRDQKDITGSLRVYLVVKLSADRKRCIRVTEFNTAVFTVMYCCRSLHSRMSVVPYTGFSTINAVTGLRPIGLSQNSWSLEDYYRLATLPAGWRIDSGKSRKLFNPLNTELNSICHLLVLLGAHHILHVSGIRVKSVNKETVVVAVMKVLKYFSTHNVGCRRKTRWTCVDVNQTHFISTVIL